MMSSLDLAAGFWVLFLGLGTAVAEEVRVENMVKRNILTFIEAEPSHHCGFRSMRAVSQRAQVS